MPVRHDLVRPLPVPQRVRRDAEVIGGIGNSQVVPELDHATASTRASIIQGLVNLTKGTASCNKAGSVSRAFTFHDNHSRCKAVGIGGDAKRGSITSSGSEPDEEAKSHIRI